jgi:hypothetical protein
MSDTMTTPARLQRRARTAVATAAAGAAVLALASCGGGNPLANPDLVSNPLGTSGQKLSFAYFQKCINPVLQANLQIDQGGVISTNRCAGSGCHDNTNGTGGALRLVQTLQTGDLTNAANTPDVVRATDMYKNFYSSQGEVVIGSSTQSRLLAKPLLLNVLHGGGQIFPDLQDTNAKLIQYWISRPMPAGQDEFSAAADSMFTPAGDCNN